MNKLGKNVKVVIGKRGDSILEPLPFSVPSYIEGLTLGSFIIVEVGGRLRIGCVVGEWEGRAGEPVLAILPIPPLPSTLLALAHWLSSEYLCSLQDSLQSMVPEILNASPSLYLYPNVAYEKVRGKVRKQMVREASEGISYTTLKAFPTSEARKKILALLNRNILLPKVELSFKEIKKEEVVPLPPLPQVLHSPSSIPSYPTQVLWGGNRVKRLGYYLGVISEVVSKGGNVLLIMPDVPSAEWAGQTLAQFISRTYIYHRQMPLAKRFPLWLELASSFHSTLVVGNRSAIFIPLPNLKLIIIEGDGEPSLIRQDPPSYDAGTVALQRAVQEGSRLIFGSDLPSLPRFYLANKKGAHLVRLPFQTGELEIKDIREEKRIIPSSTKEAIEEALNKKGKVLLIVNRRGLFYLVCKDCGNAFLCPSCNVPLIVRESQEGRSLFCHLCGTFSEAPDVCPNCGSYNISARGIGIQRLSSAAKRLFPKAKVVSVSSEIPRPSFWEADIIIATKYIVPWVEVIKPVLSCIFDIDALLSFPHFNQYESVYRLIFTLRKESERLIIHSKQVDNPLFNLAPLEFLIEESRKREEKRLPPFGHILYFLFDDARETRAKEKAGQLYEYLLSKGCRCLPPFPSLYPKRKGKYRYLLVIPSLTLPWTRRILKLASRFDRHLKWFLDIQEMI